jgi:septal ring factor EnvC (AmiA/AmiB activator)
VWEPDRKLYALLLCVLAFLLVASLATVSPEEMFLVTKGELLSLKAISERLREDSQMLKSEAESWKQNSEQLEIELENSDAEISNLQSRLKEQQSRLTELGNMLKESQTQAQQFKELVMELGTRASGLMKLSEQLKRDLSQMRRSRDFWRILSGVLAVLAGVGWTMILYYP